jgi:hypothetical protein
MPSTSTAPSSVETQWRVWFYNRELESDSRCGTLCDYIRCTRRANVGERLGLGDTLESFPSNFLVVSGLVYT